MNDRQFRLPRKESKPETNDAVTGALSRADLKRLKANTQDSSVQQTDAISADELDGLRRHGQREQVGRLPRPQDRDVSATESISREQLAELTKRGEPNQVGRLPGPAAPRKSRFGREKKSSRPRSLLRELGIVVAIALVLSVLVKTLLVQPFWIPSGSMENALVRGDRVVVSKLTPGPFDLKRGDVVVFSDDENWLESPNVERSAIANAIVKPLQFVGLYPEGDDHLIKRLIGLPGDSVSCVPGERMKINGQPVSEPYLYSGDEACDEPFDIVVPQGRAWVMGDHRSGSSDSRAHDEESGGLQGSIPIDSITGRAVAIVWPLDRMGGLSNFSSTFDKVPNS
ncbi:hypothetical protein GCM10027599_01240 [Yimella radicis]